MDSADQVILVLELILTMGPVAVYFLGLGLASSQAHPCLVSERSDFVLLALAFVPLILWPVVALVQAGNLLITFALVSAVLVLFFSLLPRRHGGWVIYNISDSECRRAVRRACQRIGWSVEKSGSSREDTDLIVNQERLEVSFHSMPWLRNVTIRCNDCDGDRERQTPRVLLDALAGELRREPLLPSPTGAGLVIIGATLLGLPMWYFFHNMDAIVDVVRRMILA